MTLLDHLRLMARYNAWMNEKAYDAAARLSPEEAARDRGAFFGSVLGTLNHLMVADLIWCHRFAPHPAASPALDPVLAMARPDALDQTITPDLAALRAMRRPIDAALVDFVAALDEDGTDRPITYVRTDGGSQTKPLGPVLCHLFNHQTHHRGQLSTLLTQAGVDIGVTDLNALVPALD